MYAGEVIYYYSSHVVYNEANHISLLRMKYSLKELRHSEMYHSWYKDSILYKLLYNSKTCARIPCKALQSNVLQTRK